MVCRPQAEIRRKKTELKVWQRVDSTKFIYRPFGAHVIHLGNDAEALKGAANAALQCLLMGPPFIKVHPQTKMVNYALAELSWEETFTHSWSQAVSYYSGDDNGGAGGSGSSAGGSAGTGMLGVPQISESGGSRSPAADTPQKRGAPKPTTSPAADDPATKKNRSGNSNPGQPDNTGPTPRVSPRAPQGDAKQLAGLIKDSQKTKNNFLSATAKASFSLRRFGGSIISR
jgi:hypothetical protein